MRLRRSSRSIVALITAVLLLLCQTAFAAQACGHDFVSTNPSTASVPCHEGMDEGGSMPHTPAAASACDAPKAVAEAVKVPVFSITDFPALPIAHESVAPVTRLSFTPLVRAACHSPPLTLLHCRFLN
jgi:hypothetical protein